MLFVYSVAALGNMKDQKFIRGSPWPQDAYNLLRDRTQITTRLDKIYTMDKHKWGIIVLALTAYFP